MEELEEVGSAIEPRSDGSSCSGAMEVVEVEI